jgi:hypothetical protein
MTSEKLKGKIRRARLRAWVSAGSPNENYGFGSNWTLNIGRGSVPKKQLWLGQGGKVTARLLGVDYSDYVKMTSEKIKRKTKFASEHEWISNPRINRIITKDIIRSAFDENYMGDAVNPISTKRLKKLMKAQSWDLSVQ